MYGHSDTLAMIALPCGCTVPQTAESLSGLAEARPTCSLNLVTMLDNEFPIFPSEIEVRAKGFGRMISASFPYNRTATIRSGGRVRKERFNTGSLSWQVREFEKVQAELSSVIKSSIDKVRKAKMVEQLEDTLEKRNTFMLAGHDYGKSIADMRSGTLAVEHTDSAVLLRAEIAAAGEAPTWIEDAVKAIKGGQLRGVSPGFQVPVKGSERLVPEVGNPGVLIREIDDAVAFEYSLLARPAYAGTGVDVRAEDMGIPTQRRRVWL